MTLSTDGLLQAESVLRNPARLEALHRVSLMSASPGEAFDRLARMAAKLLDAPTGMVNFIDAERQFFPGCFGLAEPWASKREIPSDWGFCPITLTAGRPLLLDDVTTMPEFTGDPAIKELGVVAYAGIPLIDQAGYALGTLCVVDVNPRAWTTEDVANLHDLAAMVFSELQLRALAEEQQRLLDAFEHAPSLVAILRGPDHAVTFANAAHVRAFGGFRLGTPGRLAFPTLAEEGFFDQVDTAYRSGRPVAVGEKKVTWEVTHDQAAQGQATEGQATEGHFTFVCSPLPAPSGDVDGILMVGIDVTEQAWAREELRTSEQRSREAALTLQRSMLPAALHQPDSLEAAGRYIAGSPDSAVGGDWFDVIPVGADRTALVIGDVMGRGIRAAAVMGQLRTAVRAYARLDLPPSEILELLDGLVQEIADEQIVTCVYATYDPADGILTYASAGHLPPLLVEPCGTVRRLEAAHGAPLGVKAGPFRAGQAQLSPGSTVTLYTDGLVEERDQDIDTGIDLLTKTLLDGRQELEELCDDVLTKLHLPDCQIDDIALLVFRVREPSPDDGRPVRLPLAGDPMSAYRAREFTARSLRDWHVPEALVDDALVVVSELVSNSLRHGTGPRELRLRRSSRQLYVEVCDANPSLPYTRPAELLDEKGRGLQIVATLGQRWGARRTESGKSVWCQFLLPAMPSALLPAEP